MRMKFVFAVVAGLILAAAAFAQGPTPNFSGHWDLDVSKSKLDERARIQSMSLDVAQSATTVKVDTKTTRAPRPDGAGGGGGQGGGGGMGRGGGFGGGGDQSATYTLDGKETTVDTPGPNGSIPSKLKADLDAGKLHLSSASTFTTPNGDFSRSTKETWSLSDDGRTLTVERESTTSRGSNSSTMVFVKK
ncbi:MAG: hypothetical protein ACRD43_15550 [Pyrinomonadaceae bacterium]